MTLVKFIGFNLSIIGIPCAFYLTFHTDMVFGIILIILQLPNFIGGITYFVKELGK